METTRHTPLNDKISLHYFELPKLPEVGGTEDELKLCLALFNAETEEELIKLEAMGVNVMTQAISAYRHVAATDEFKEIERLRSRARHNEASALGNARREGEESEREKWLGIVADKDAVLADKDVTIANKDAALANKEAAIADKEAAIADKEAENEKLRKLLAELQSKSLK